MGKILVFIIISTVLIFIVLLLWMSVQYVSAPSPTPDSLHNSITFQAKNSCKEEITHAIYYWALEKDLQTIITASDNATAIFIIPKNNQLYFIEIFHYFYESKNTVELDINMIPKRDKNLISTSFLIHEWKLLEIDQLFQSLIINQPCTTEINNFKAHKTN